MIKSIGSFVLASLMFNSLAQAEILLALSSGPGYVLPKDSYSVNCAIDVDGTFKYEYVDPHTQVTRTGSLSAKEIAALTAMIEEVRKTPGTVALYQTGAGDLPGYHFSAYPGTEGKTLALHSDGKDIVRNSKAGRQLFRKVVRTCGMRVEILKQRLREMMTGDDEV